jgi:O-antigen ligase
MIGLAAAGLALLAVAGAIMVVSPEARRLGLPVRLVEMFDPHSPSIRHRLGLLAVTARMIGADPVFGAGPGRYGAAFGDTLERLAREESGVGFWQFARVMRGNYIGEAHCDPLQWWAEYGLLTIAGLFLMLGAALAGARRALRSGACAEPAAGALWVALAVLSLNLWVAFPLHRPVRAMLFWTLLGLAASLRHAPRSR